MKHLLNSLYITTQGTYLAREGETVVVRREKETKLQIPIHTLSGILCFGQVSCSPPLMGLCGARNVTLAFFSEQGRFLARVYGPVSGNVLLRKEQYRRSENEEKSSEIARSVVIAKIANCRTVLLRAAREHANPEASEALSLASAALSKHLQVLSSRLPLDSVRGIEGDAASSILTYSTTLFPLRKMHSDLPNEPEGHRWIPSTLSCHLFIHCSCMTFRRLWKEWDLTLPSGFSTGIALEDQASHST
jgi:CRISPR-associated protein Cas1